MYHRNRLKPDPRNPLWIAASGALGGGGYGITYLINDEFTTDRAAGSVNGTAAEPGPGTRVVTDAENKLSVSGGAIVISRHTTYNQFARLHITPFVTRAAGIVILQTVKITTTGAVHFGVHSAATEPAYNNGHLALYASNATLPILANFNAVQYGQSTISWPGVGVDVKICFIVRTNGGHVLVKISGVWYRVHVSRRGSSADLYMYISGFPTGASSWEGTMDNLAAYQLQSGVFLSDEAGATGYKETTANGDTFAMDANGIVTHWITAATGVTQELMFRREDDNNTMLVRMNQGASTVKLIKIDSGVETELGSAAQTWTDTTQYEIVVHCNSTAIIVYVDGAKKIGITNSYNLLSTGVKVSRAGAYFETWPIVESRLPFDYAPNNGVFGFGDSKTYGVDDDGIDGENGYLTRMPTYGFKEMPGRLAKSGWTVAMFAATIEADLAAITQYAPVKILANLGSNDLVSLPAESTWKNDYQTILDAFGKKWPGVPIYIMRPWRRNYDSEADTMANWIADLISTNSDVYIGPDERDFLKGEDDGETYTSDGIHPNAIGHDITAQQWAQIIQ